MITPLCRGPVRSSARRDDTGEFVEAPGPAVLVALQIVLGWEPLVYQHEVRFAAAVEELDRDEGLSPPGSSSQRVDELFRWVDHLVYPG
jgi:hypothetical protein